MTAMRRPPRRYSRRAPAENDDGGWRLHWALWLLPVGLLVAFHARDDEPTDDPRLTRSGTVIRRAMGAATHASGEPVFDAPELVEVRLADGPPLERSSETCAATEEDVATSGTSLEPFVRERVAAFHDRAADVRTDPDASVALREGVERALVAHTELEGLLALREAPDRVRRGVDLYVAALVALGDAAIGNRDLERASDTAALARREAPDDVVPLVLEGYVATRRGEHTRAADAFSRAHRLQPGDPAILHALARALRHGPDAAAAVAAYDAYLRMHPDAAATRRREHLARRADAMRGYRLTRRNGITMVAPADEDQLVIGTALDTIEAALTRAAVALDVGTPTSLSVFVYPTNADMRTVTCSPGWSGAMFDGALHLSLRLLDTGYGRQVIAHETAHAAIRAALPDVAVPSWLNEGLAQYVANEDDGRADRTFRVMIDEHAFMPFASIDGTFGVIEDPRDARFAYHQSLAMVLWLVERRGERGLAEALDYLAAGGDPARVLEETLGAPLDTSTLRAFLVAREARRARR